MSLLATTALLLALAPAHATPAHRTAVPFIDDDYGRALAEARTRNVPLFVEMWAPW